MTEPKGWLKLHRTIMTSSVFSNPKLLKFWIWILCKAFTVPAKVTVGLQEVDVEKGQFVFGRFAAANELQMTNSTVYKYLKLLEKERMVAVKSNNKFSLVSVVNWGDYQDKKEKGEQQSNNKVTTKEQQSNTNKECKEYKEIKNKDSTFQNIINEYTTNEQLIDALNAFVSMRKDIKKPLTERAMNMLLTRLTNISKDDDVLKIKLLDQSVFHNWQDVFPLKEDGIKAEQISKPMSMSEMQKAALQIARQKEGRR